MNDWNSLNFRMFLIKGMYSTSDRQWSPSLLSVLSIIIYVRQLHWDIASFILLYSCPCPYPRLLPMRQWYQTHWLFGSELCENVIKAFLPSWQAFLRNVFMQIVGLISVMYFDDDRPILPRTELSIKHRFPRSDNSLPLGEIQQLLQLYFIHLFSEHTIISAQEIWRYACYFFHHVFRNSSANITNLFHFQSFLLEIQQKRQSYLTFLYFCRSFKLRDLSFCLIIIRLYFRRQYNRRVLTHVTLVMDLLCKEKIARLPIY